MGKFAPSGPASPSIVTTQSKSAFTTSGGISVGLTETTISIPIGTRAFELRAVGAAKLTISDTIGGTASNLTSYELMPGRPWREEQLTGTSAITVYIKSSKASTDVQLLVWT